MAQTITIRPPDPWRHPSDDPAFCALSAIFVTSVALDIISSRGLKEGNPILGQNAWRQGLIAGGIAGFTLWGANYLEKHGERRLAKITLTVGSFIHGGVAVWNRQLKEGVK